MKNYLILALIISLGFLFVPACKKDKQTKPKKAKVTKVEKPKQKRVAVQEVDPSSFSFNDDPVTPEE